MLVGAVVLLALLLPRSEASAAGVEPAQLPLAGVGAEAGDAGEELVSSEDDCAEGQSQQEQELVECAARYEPTLDEPVLVALMRDLGVEMSAAECDELLRELWSEQSCAGRGRDCGKINTGAPPAPGPRFASSSSSARAAWANLELGGPRSGGLSAWAEASEEFRSRDLQPPLPPPKLALH